MMCAIVVFVNYQTTRGEIALLYYDKYKEISSLGQTWTLSPLLLCQKTVVEKAHYTGHASAQHKIRQFVCKKCNKGYAYKASFTRHMKVCKKTDNTSTIQEYKCDICSSTFSKKDILTDQVKGTHGCSTGSCNVCGKRFRYRAFRSKHTKYVHQ